MLIRFHLIPERHGQTDGRTELLSISRVSVLTRDKNRCNFCLTVCMLATSIKLKPTGIYRVIMRVVKR